MRELRSTNANRYGLSPDIPESVRREVRRRGGFGCVVCGSAIVEYHHFDPPYAEAHAHSPSGITTLCPTCHAKITSGRLSSSALDEAVRNPHALEVGYSHDAVECSGLPTVLLGGLELRGTPIALEVDGRVLLGFGSPEAAGAPFGLNALFCDNAGNPIAEIVENEWHAWAHNWDVDTVGRRTTIRTAYRNVSLVFRTEPPSTIVVERIDMFYGGLRLEGREGSHLSAYLLNGRLFFRATPPATIVGCSRGIVIGCRT
jgi:hypothetical protein